MANQKGGEANIGLFIGVSQLAKLIQMDGEDIKTELLKLVAEA